MSNKVITVELNSRTQETIVPQTAICLEETNYLEIQKEIITIEPPFYDSTITFLPPNNRYTHKEYKLSEDFIILFRSWSRIQNAKHQKNLNTTDRYSGRKCYIILLGDEKIIIDEEEIVGRQ